MQINSSAVELIEKVTK